MKPLHRLASGFTLIELLIVVAIVAVIAALAGPAMGDYVKMQRLRGISDGLATDFALARSEAVSRGAFAYVRVQPGTGMSCYIIWARDGNFNDTDLCDCTQAAGSRCSAANAEIKTVQVPSSQSVALAPVAGNEPVAAFNPRNGGLWVGSTAEASLQTRYNADTAIDSARTVRAYVNQSGRALLCAPSGSTVRIQSCPP